MPHVSPQQMQEWAGHHAERAHELLTQVDASLATLLAKPLSPVATLSALDTSKIELAEAHAQVALALSSAVLPSVSPTPPTAS